MKKCKKVFGSITEEQIQESIQNVLKKRQQILDCIPESEKEILNKRIDFLEKHIAGPWLV